MESYKYQTTGGERWAVRETKEERYDTEQSMANPPPGSLREPHYPVYEIFCGVPIRRWVEYENKKA
jgi:hypothetical protein